MVNLSDKIIAKCISDVENSPHYKNYKLLLTQDDSWIQAFIRSLSTILEKEIGSKSKKKTTQKKDK